jgi:hypothetical protein
VNTKKDRPLSENNAIIWREEIKKTSNLPNCSRCGLRTREEPKVKLNVEFNLLR